MHNVKNEVAISKTVKNEQGDEGGNMNYYLISISLDQLFLASFS